MTLLRGFSPGYTCGAAALAALLLLGAAPRAGAENEEASLVAIEEEIFVAVNRHRESRGLKTLKYKADIAALARAHSEAMASGEVGFGHDGLNARTGRIMKRFTVKAVAENISKHSYDRSEVTEKAMANWLASDVHRNNIESRHQITGVGVAVADDGTIYLTQIFVRTR